MRSNTLNGVSRLGWRASRPSIKPKVTAPKATNEAPKRKRRKKERKGDFFGRIYRPQKESHKSTYISEYVPFNAHAMCASCPERSSSVCVGVLRRIITPLTARCLLAPTITVVCVHAGWLAGRPAWLCSNTKWQWPAGNCTLHTWGSSGSQTETLASHSVPHLVLLQRTTPGQKGEKLRLGKEFFGSMHAFCVKKVGMQKQAEVIKRPERGKYTERNKHLNSLFGC